MKKDWSQLKEKIENLRQIEDIWKIAGILAVTLILFGTGLVELGQLSKHTVAEVETEAVTEEYTTETGELQSGEAQDSETQAAEAESAEIPVAFSGRCRV